MYPHERSLVEKLKGRPFALIGVNSDRDKAKLKTRMEKEKITWRSFWCGPQGARAPGSIPNKWNVRGWPTVYILDGKGVVRYKHKGFLRGEELEKAVEKLLNEAEAAKAGGKRE
jgi:hypothetical protein